MAKIQTVNLTLNEAQRIVDYLTERPWKEAQPLIQLMFAAQERSKPRPKPRPARKDGDDA